MHRGAPACAGRAIDLLQFTICTRNYCLYGMGGRRAIYLACLFLPRREPPKRPRASLRPHSLPRKNLPRCAWRKMADRAPAGGEPPAAAADGPTSSTSSSVASSAAKPPPPGECPPRGGPAARPLQRAPRPLPPPRLPAGGRCRGLRSPSDPPRGGRRRGWKLMRRAFCCCPPTPASSGGGVRRRRPSSPLPHTHRPALLPLHPSSPARRVRGGGAGHARRGRGGRGRRRCAGRQGAGMRRAVPAFACRAASGCSITLLDQAARSGRSISL